MSKREITTCDRCGTVYDEADEREGCARAFVQTRSGRDVVGTEEMPADLCSGCVVDLAEFMVWDKPEPAAKPKRGRK